MMVTYIRTIIVYLVLILVIRLLGKRQIGQMEPSEFVVAMLLADLASVPMQDGSIPLVAGLVPSVTVLGAELILSGLSMGSVKVRRVLCGKPVILIGNGKILQNNLRRTRVTLDELMGHLREKDVLDISQVQYAILETNGNLSVFPYPRHMPASAEDAGIKPSKQGLPVTIIDDGCLQKQNLSLVRKNETWVKDTLARYKATVSDTFLLTVDENGQEYWVGKEKKA